MRSDIVPGAFFRAYEPQTTARGAVHTCRGGDASRQRRLDYRSANSASYLDETKGSRTKRKAKIRRREKRTMTPQLPTSKERNNEHGKGHPAMNTPPIMSEKEWEAARQQLLVKEKALTRSRDALAAERRRMPWMAVEKKYEFDGLKGKVSLLGLFEGRRQLIVYRAFFEPGVFGWPEHACRGCSLGADQVSPPGPSERPRHHSRLDLPRAAS